jgi:hypothetical protein
MAGTEQPLRHECSERDWQWAQRTSPQEIRFDFVESFGRTIPIYLQQEA